MVKKFIKYIAYGAFFTVPTSTPTDLSASMTSQFADTGFLAVVVLAAGIPLTFYVIKKLIRLIPKDKDSHNFLKPETKERISISPRKSVHEINSFVYTPKEERADKATIKYLKRLREIEHY